MPKPLWVAGHARIPDDQIIMSCVAMGYPADGFRANDVVSKKRQVDNAVGFVGYDDLTAWSVSSRCLRNSRVAVAGFLARSRTNRTENVMMISDANEDRFVSDHRWAVLTTLRSDGQPVSSVVAYAREGDTLIVSTPGATFKRRSLDRDARATLCIISNREPFNFVSVEGRATIETDDLAPGTARIFDNIADAGYPAPDDMDAWLAASQRVLIRLHPERIHSVLR